LNRLVTGGPPGTREVITLKQQGLKFVEIAEKTGIEERTVRRVIEAARKRQEGE